jgi:hypothetical protein
MLDKIANTTSNLCENSLTVLEKNQELTPSTNEAGDIKFIKTTDETITASLNAVAHMVFSKERFMTKCEAIEANEPKISFKNNNSKQNEKKRDS